MLRGSARSIREFDIGAALAGCGDLFTRHGGHRYAAGFEMVPENLPALEARLRQAAEETLPRPTAQPLYIDAEVSVANLVGETFRWLRELEPFGVDNPAPAFLTRGLRPSDVRQMGDRGQHLRLKLREGRVTWDAVAFRQGGQWPGDAPQLDVVYNLGTDWRGSTEVLALRVLDFRPAYR
jgi:single-stranded-DNA-specific exonuclease